MVHDPPCPLLGEVGPAGVVEQICGVDIGLVAVPVVRARIPGRPRRVRLGEEAVELLHKVFAALEEGDHALGIKGRSPTPLQCAALDVVPGVFPLAVEVGQQQRLERLDETSLRAPRLEVLRSGVPYVPIGLRVLAEERGVLGMAEGFGEQGDGVVGPGVFQRARDAIPHQSRGTIAVLQILFHAFAPGEGCPRRCWAQGRSAHRLVSLGYIEIPYPFQEGVRDHNICRRAQHGIRVASPRRPAGEPAALLQHLHQRHEHVPLILGRNQRVKRMHGAERVPQ